MQHLPRNHAHDDACLRAPPWSGLAHAVYPLPLISKVINDGEVTALTVVQKIKPGNDMGISMGSSEGAADANADGNLMGWIRKFCYVKLDLNPRR